MKIKIVSTADRIARAEEQEKADKWDRVFIFWPRETKSGEYSFLCFVERCPRVIKKRVIPSRPPGPGYQPIHDKIITWRYRAIKQEK